MDPAGMLTRCLYCADTTMGKSKKTRKFAVAKKMISPRDPRL